MNVNKETNINVRTNVIDSSMKFRISYERPEGKEHKRYIPQYAENGSDVWKRFVYYHNGHQPPTLKTSRLGSESGNARSAEADGD